MTAKEVITTPVEAQFVDAGQQHEAVTLGMWIFLASECLFFGGPLLAYTVYRHWYFTDFSVGSQHLDFTLGTTNTGILLASSLFMSGALTAVRILDRKNATILLLLTAASGLVFVCVKGYEWHSVIAEGYWPSAQAGGDSRGLHLFFSSYFVLTGLHVVHLLIGIVLIAGTALRYFSSQEFRPNQNYLTLLGLYWHFVDIVWVFLYPLLYLIGGLA